ncbi:xanthine dehydrogenase family protein molybdopterin-binding subunit [Halosimplex litoreum]|uniref:Xanthine dehydrogenase family protein molybdopterin-binding subunit n=1 Tax=Halosimplex litoreum TaxID=1198301 RepID=A0A7U3WAF5_9EURY|nr:xanthine dehydrogenase family protein molybdopterin-binding subunit [Halosimplex litoreum]QPV64600.1 xanthine dehydrogenase family protein molybdopterin-binding subunit [Halosimplex litoreum]
MTDDARADRARDGPGDAERLVGQGVDRREDAALLTGDATYTDDIARPDLASLTFVRSEVAHADIESIDTTAAESMAGVLAVYTWDDVADSEVPGVLPISTHGLDCDPPGHPVLARDRVRYQGQPVAAVVAEDRYRASDAADAVDVTADSCPAVVDQREAQRPDAPTLYEDAPDNVAATSELGDRETTDDAIADADHVVELDLTNNRLIPTALEPRAAVARWDAGDERLTVDLTSQSPHGHRGKLSTTLDLPESDIRVVAPSVGGGFGHKGHHHPGEAAAAFAAMDLGVPVKWTATRSGNYLAGAHGRDHRTAAELGVDDDGTLRALRVETDANVGAYGLGSSLGMPGWYGSLLSGQYDIPAIHCETRAVFTNTAPIHSYRGAGRPEANYVAERLVGAAARELDLDPAELRRGNQITEFPTETAVGATYDSGDYELGLDEALDAAGWDDLRSRPDRDDEGRYLGVGLACYVESTGGGMESGVVRAHSDGTVTVSAGTHSHGQGHATTYAQIVADELGVDADAIGVREGDSDAIPQGTGTFGSRSTITGGNAVAESARAVREKARALAANLLDAPVDDLAYRDGVFSAPAHTDETRTFADVAEAAYGWGVPDGMDPGLEATTFFEQDETAYTFGTHVVAVAVDPETGAVDIERYVALDDCGERINPTIVEGQVRGGVAQGIGQARYEQAVYADDGTLETDSMLDYAVPRSFHVPDIETEATVTPSPTNDLGVKGIGEAGTIAAPPAVVNAVCDALAPLGIDHVDMPLTGDSVRSAVRDAGE